MSEIISSLQNPKIKNAIKLKESGERREQGLFLIEGKREIKLAMVSGVEIVTLFYCPRFDGAEARGHHTSLLTKINEHIIIEVAAKVFAKMSYRQNPDGLLAVAKARELNWQQVKLSARPLIVVVEAVEKPGNLGAILRTCDAAGADLVIVNDPKCDIYNHNVIRSSQGTVFSRQIITASAGETVSWLKKNNIKTFAAAPLATTLYADADYRGPSAIVLGAEDQGLSPAWLKAADEQIKIPMRGLIDSLNVSVSAAVILFEAVRQRLGK